MGAKRPRVWHVLVLGALYVPIVVFCIRLVVTILESAGLERSDHVLFGVFIEIAVDVGLLVLLVRRSSEKLADRLLLREGRLSLWYSPLIYAGGFAAVAIGGMMTLIAFGAHSPRVRELQNVVQSGEGGGLLSLLISMALVPAISEELIFRGYIQSRLLKRYPARAAILISSFFFAVAHGDVRYACAIFPLAMWFGYVAYISESIWPGVICHFIHNAFVTIVAWSGRDQIGPEEPRQMIQSSSPWEWLGYLLIIAIAGAVIAWMARILKDGCRPASTHSRLDQVADAE